ncbi:MAG: hypothetical protein RL550_878 [Actinomycetota bacterium]
MVLSTCIAGWRSPEADFAHSLLSGRPDCRVLPLHSTGVEVIEALRVDSIDAVLLPFDWIEVARSIKKDVAPALPNDPALVLIGHNPRLGTRARALSSGFDGVIDLSDDPESLVTTLSRICSSSARGDSDVLQTFGVIPDLLIRPVQLTDSDDSDLLDLLAIGSTDEEIAHALDWNIQKVRNHIASLLEINGMKYRTQLAVTHVSSARIPDFVRTVLE